MKSLISVAFACLSIGAFTQPKIAVVDARLVIQKSSQGQKVQAELEELRSTRQQELSSIEEDMRTIENQLKDDQLDADTKRTLSLELQEKQKELQRNYEDAQEEFQRETNARLQQLEREIVPLIREIGQSMGYQLIFDRNTSGLLYADNAIDITDAVIEKYNAMQ